MTDSDRGETQLGLRTLAPVWNLPLLAEATSQSCHLRGVRLLTRWLQTPDPCCLNKKAAPSFLSLKIHAELFFCQRLLVKVLVNSSKFRTWEIEVVRLFYKENNEKAVCSNSQSQLSR